jgi:hypothetical protein
VAVYRQKIMDRIAVTQLIRKMLLDMTRQVYVKIKEIEDAKEGADGAGRVEERVVQP